LPEEIDSKDYEWQGRAYMWLYNKPEFELVYCMVSTWDEFLTQYDDRLLHKVDHIDPAKRITSIKFERDLELEERMIERVKWANEYYKERINKLNKK
jgi:predicted MarR family transcription regulator